MTVHSLLSVFLLQMKGEEEPHVSPAMTSLPRWTVSSNWGGGAQNKHFPPYVTLVMYFSHSNKESN